MSLFNVLGAKPAPPPTDPRPSAKGGGNWGGGERFSRFLPALLASSEASCGPASAGDAAATAFRLGFGNIGCDEVKFCRLNSKNAATLPV